LRFIRIELTRDPAQGRLELTSGPAASTDRSLPEITSLSVIDNGIGFTKDNYESFLRVGTRQKAQIGGKGIGRLTWLKAFEVVHIDSLYHQDHAVCRRAFTFRLPDGIEDERNEEVNEGRASTTVSLRGLRTPFAPHLRHRGITIGKEIVKHFLAHFISGATPQITIVDGEDIVDVSLDDLMGRTRAGFSLGGHRFSIDHVKIRSPAERRHSIYYCADSRVVRSERLTILPPSRLQDEDEPFYYQAYVSSEFLDSSVNAERTGFLIEEESTLVDDVSYSDLSSEVERSANDFLDPYLAALVTAREARITNVVTSRLPEYQYIRTYNAADLERIPYDATEPEIENAVATLHFQNQKTGRLLLDEVVREMQRVAKFDPESFAATFEKQFEEFNQVNQASLLSYLSCSPFGRGLS
jgi:hypothetical protein